MIKVASEIREIKMNSPLTGTGWWAAIWEGTKVGSVHTIHQVKLQVDPMQKCKQQNYKSPKRIRGGTLYSPGVGKPFWFQCKNPEARKENIHKN